MTIAPHSAMVLAAGLGKRMRPLTNTTAKPLLTLGGRTLLDHALDHLLDAGVRTVAVNAHWHADAVAAHLARRPPSPATVLLREEHLLETGGGVRAALTVLGDDPFFVVNGDTFWLNGPILTLLRLAAVFDDGGCRAAGPSHLPRPCRCRTGRLRAGQVGHPATPQGTRGRPLHLRRRATGPPACFPACCQRCRAGVQHEPAWDIALEAGRLRAVVHDGIWFHLSTPPDLHEAEQILEARVTGDARWPWR